VRTKCSGKLLEVFGSLFNMVIHNPEFLLHVFDNLFVFTYFLVFTRNMAISTPQYKD